VVARPLFRVVGEGLLSPWWLAWPIARTALGMIFRRKLFWGLYILSLLAFLVYFFGIYLLAWAQTQLGQGDVRVGGLGRANPQDLVNLFRSVLKMDGSGETYRNYISFQGYMVMIVLALAGSVLIGNDLRFGSLPFYLSKPLSSWHYLLGKGLAVSVFINLMTTLPALVLFLEYGLLEPVGASEALPIPWFGLICLGVVVAVWAWRGRISLVWLGVVGVVMVAEYMLLLTGDWFRQNVHLALGILGYGAILTVSLTLLLLATATWLQKTVPLILAWATLFFFARILSDALVDRLAFDARWRLVDLWNCALLLGNHCLGIRPENIRPAPQPEWYEAALVLGGVCISCLIYSSLRIRAVEIVR
jgi:hypothetical protein